MNVLVCCWRMVLGDRYGWRSHLFSLLFVGLTLGAVFLAWNGVIYRPARARTLGEGSGGISNVEVYGMCTVAGRDAWDEFANKL